MTKLLVTGGMELLPGTGRDEIPHIPFHPVPSLMGRDEMGYDVVQCLGEKLPCERDVDQCLQCHFEWCKLRTHQGVWWHLRIFFTHRVYVKNDTKRLHTTGSMIAKALIFYNFFIDESTL